MTYEIPFYHTRVFSPKRSNYCVCIYVLNEGQRIRSQLQKMQPYIKNIDILIADGGSTDGSLDSDFLSNHTVRTLLAQKNGAPGLSSQMRMAFSYAMKEGYKGIVSMDGNDKDDPSALGLFIKALKEGYDHIQGSRFIPGGRQENTPFLRLLAVRFLHIPLIRLWSGFPYTDSTNGFRAYSMRFLRDTNINPFRSVFIKYELHYYLAIRAAQLDFRVIEVPVARIYPRKGRVPTKISLLNGSCSIIKSLYVAYRLSRQSLKKNS